jgi:hypothetical protein
LAPLEHKERWWFCVSRLDPSWEQVAFVCLVPQVLVKIRVSDHFERLNVVDRDEMAVHVHELNTNFLECALGQQVPLDAAQCLVWIVVGLLN